MIKIADTKYGKVEGIEVDNSYVLYKGIPYAAPPVGELRWKEPLPPKSWEGIRQCFAWGNACPQETPHTPDVFYGKEFYAGGDYPPVMDEDCLYLNIWTPAKTTEDKLPVMMWMHGGGVVSGYSHEMEFDGKAYCERDVILVTINYRLNIFGFFVHPELAAESPHNASGNYGIMDQRQALLWLKENIAAFGGDPDNITIFGQSGGGRSTQALSCSPLTRGLFRHAIVQSAGGVSTAFGKAPKEMMEERGINMMKECGLNSIEEMRQLSWEELLGHYKNYMSTRGIAQSFNICTDGYVLVESMGESLISGIHHDIDYMIGGTCDEGLDVENMKPFTPDIMPSIRNWGRLQNVQGKKPAYMYCFSRLMPGDDMGAFHSADLWYMFHTLDRCWRPLEERDYQLADIMVDYWSNFAKNGNPNGEGLPPWEPFDSRELMMKLAIEGCEMTDYGNDKLRAVEDRMMEKVKG